MNTESGQDDLGDDDGEWFDIAYPASGYTFPGQALIHQILFDDSSIHVELTDGRVLSIPLNWIPTLLNATPADRKKFRITEDRTGAIWDPREGPINDELFIKYYLSPVCDPKS